MIRALVKTRDIYIDEKLNLLVMKDTPEAIRLAEQLVATQDLAEPEVMLDVEVLEVASNLLRDFGLRYPDQINFGVLSPDSNLPSNIELKPRTWEYFVANPGLMLNIHQLDGAVNLLANPRIRVRNREKAKVHIGEKVPVITTTSTANVGVSSSVSYLETGLKLDVEPNVYLENEVAIKVELEVSNILEQLNVSGTVSYRLGTRNAATTLRLHDGETQVLAGLINDEDRRSANKLPYLGDFPILGRLFRSDSDSHNKTEIVLLITPHIVRNLARPGTVQAQFSSGTDAAPGAVPLRLSSTAPGAFRLSSTDAGALVSSAAADRINGDASAGAAMALDINGPTQASIGEDFILSFGLPVHIEGATAKLQLSYDPALLALVGGASGDNGNAELAVSAATIAGTAPAPAQARFRVIAKAPGTTQIGIALLSANDNLNRPLNVQAPAAHSLNIVGREGGNIYTPQPIIPAPTIPVTPNATSDAAPDAAAAPIEAAPQ
jgi:general secretion pathway protein D